jgi:hypothetical protein
MAAQRRTRVDMSERQRARLVYVLLLVVGIASTAWLAAQFYSLARTTGEWTPMLIGGWSIAAIWIGAIASFMLTPWVIRHRPAIMSAVRRLFRVE